jgi:glyoxylase-like metal-dependent hydrolase (beta-lactamase superfamily II)
MIFGSLEVGPLQVNCYILGCEKTKEAVVIDAGGDVDKILNVLNKNNLNLKYILCTHSHFDHISGNKELKDATNAKIIIHSAEADSITNISSSAMLFGINIHNSPPADILIKHGDIIKVGEEILLETLHTPGHSAGSCSFILQGLPVVFVGDTLFAGSIGRTDLPGGDYNTLINSVRTKLFILPDETKALPGHGPETTIGHEKKYNPFF